MCVLISANKKSISVINGKFCPVSFEKGVSKILLRNKIIVLNPKLLFWFTDRYDMFYAIIQIQIWMQHLFCIFR